MSPKKETYTFNLCIFTFCRLLETIIVALFLCLLSTTLTSDACIQFGKRETNESLLEKKKIYRSHLSDPTVFIAALCASNAQFVLFASFTPHAPSKSYLFIFFFSSCCSLRSAERSCDNATMCGVEVGFEHRSQVSHCSDVLLHRPYFCNGWWVTTNGSLHIPKNIQSFVNINNR